VTTKLGKIELKNQIAERYRREGGDVFVNPLPQAIPFDIQGYRPDILVKRPNGERLLIEVKSSSAGISVERYREIAEIIGNHVGWRFLLVTGDESQLALSDLPGHTLLEVAEIRTRSKQSEVLLSQGFIPAAFLSSWSVLEALLRRRANHVGLPIGGLATSSLVNHLYSQGELTMEQFTSLKSLQIVRNQVVHGLESLGLELRTATLIELVTELIADWFPEGQVPTS